MDTTHSVLVFPNGLISQGTKGVTFQCDAQIIVRIKRSTSLDELKQLIHHKLKLQPNEVVSELIYRIPACLKPLRFNSFQLSKDEDIKVMVDCHTRFSETLVFLEVYAKIETIEINLNEQVQRVEDCRTFTFFPPNHQTEVNVRGNEMPQFSSSVPLNDPNVDLALSSSQDIVYGTNVDKIKDVACDARNDFDSGSDKGNVNIHLALPISYCEPSSSYLSQIDTEETANKLKIPGLVRASSWDEDSDIFVGLLFPNKDSFLLALKMYSFKRYKNYKIDMSTETYVDAKCVNFGYGCNWSVRACLSTVFKGWLITGFNRDHTCVSSLISQDHHKLDSDTIASLIVDMVKEFPDVSISEVIQRIKDKFSCNVSYKNARIGKQKAIAKVYGNWEASYDFLRRWMTAVQLYMPGTVVEFQTRQCEVDKSKEFFHRVFWMYKPCIDSFEHLKPMIQIDKNLLSGKYRGMLIIAIAQDGNRHIVPIAFAVVEGETLEAWSWFLGMLRRYVVKERNGICLISDKNPLILTAISNECPDWKPPLVHHVFCMRHLASSLNSHHKNNMLKKLFVTIGYQYQPHLVDKKMRQLRSMNEEAANWIDKIPREKWCRAYDVNGRRYGHMTTNKAECMSNVLKGIRSLPITSLVQATMYKLATHFVERSTKAATQLQNGQIYCEYLRDAMRTNQSKASLCVVRSFNMEAMLFEVQEPYNQQGQKFGRVCQVLLNSRKCDCGEFQVLQYPCSHAIAARAFTSQDYLLYIDPIYRLDNIVNAYHSTFHPIGSEQDWPLISGPKLVPDPAMVRKKGRQ